MESAHARTVTQRKCGSAGRPAWAAYCVHRTTHVTPAADAARPRETYRERVNMRCEVRQWARAHRILTDTLLACLLVALSVAYLYMAPEAGTRPPGLIALILVSALALTACRRWPRAVFAV